jgi:hypothetical protein
MPHALERWGTKAIVVNSQTGKHYSTSPIPLANAQKQLRLLNAVEHGAKLKPRYK